MVQLKGIAFVAIFAPIATAIILMALRLVFGSLAIVLILERTLRTRLSELGIALPDEDAFNTAFARFKELADKKGEVFDEDLFAFWEDVDLDWRAQ